LDLLNTYRPQLQVTTPLSLIHTLYSSLQHAINPLSLLCLYQSSGNGFQRRNLLSFCVHALTARRLSPNYLNSRLVLLITPRHGLHRKHRFRQFFYCYVRQLSYVPRREQVFPVSPLVRVRNLLPSNGPTCYNFLYKRCYDSIQAVFLQNVASSITLFVALVTEGGLDSVLKRHVIFINSFKGIQLF
jgi:hypothetical protein